MAPDAGARERQDPASPRGRLTARSTPGRASRWWTPALYVVLLAAFAVGIWGSYRAVFPGPGLYRVTGVFAARAGAEMMLVRHEAVAGLMDDMESMLFFTESKELLDRAALTPGDRILLTVRKAPERLLVVEIRKVR